MTPELFGRSVALKSSWQEKTSPLDELQKDGWKDIHHAHRENAAAKKIAEAPNPTASADHATKQHRPRPKRRIPSPEKLHEEGLKIVFRSHDGLNIRKSQADILDAAYKSAGISYVQELLEAVRDIYLPPTPKSQLPPYSGLANLELDRDITEAEVRAALTKLRSNSAPGPDEITNKALRNLDDKSIASFM
ncbi:hypothetical protein HPB48_017176 [Haemaphysalis longicornis]|uniref:Uncharacterized protein n=1 Tax=Haemaphysalis longicornis TaxID=44386 RepID=A0A9J6GAW2_HAELO|nr:hypothetical protein HPB48_017176 [Haemaphysalis longicornis]